MLHINGNVIVQIINPAIPETIIQTTNVIIDTNIPMFMTIDIDFIDRIFI